MRKQQLITPEVTGNGSKETAAKDRKQKLNYPKYDLDDALAIPQAIKDNYASKPMPPQSLAKACGVSYGNTDWRVRLAASAAYGLTEGSYRASAVTLTDRARSILAPRTAEEKQRALRDAAREPEPMRRVYEHFDNGLIPDGEFFQNTLVRDFQVPEDQLERFVQILRSNARYAYGQPDIQPGSNSDVQPPPVCADEPTDTQAPEPSNPINEATSTRQAPTSSRVFISHSKNEEILDVLRTTMDIAGFEYEIAEDEETAALPVPDKIMKAMKRCSAAIINVSADEREKRTDESYGINQNVLIEIGCAFALYGVERCVLLWDKRISIPSNLQGLYRCEYAGQSLSAADLLRLQKAIANFRVLSIR